MDSERETEFLHRGGDPGRGGRTEPVVFGRYCIDRENATLSSRGKQIPLTPKAFAVLCYLLDHAGKLATRDSIFEHVWPGIIVTDAALTVCIREIRAALEDDAKNPRYIETVKKRGYRFICNTAKAPSNPARQSTGSDHWISLSSRTKRCVVGRAEPLRILRDCVREADAGCRQTALISGEPGIGKTTVLDAFRTQYCHADDVWVASGQCIEHYGEGEAYLPILDALNDLYVRAGSELAAILAAHAPACLAHLPSVQAEVQHSKSHCSEATEQAGRMLRELTGALEAIAQNRLLILILEDLHWSDLASIDLLSFLARRSNASRLLIVASVRPGEAMLQNHPVGAVTNDLAGRGCCTTVRLALLQRDHIESYLSATYPSNDFPAQFARFLCQRSAGNPLFLISLLAFLQDENLLQRSAGRWSVEDKLSEHENLIPDSIHQLINHQIERLDQSTRQLLEAASVVSEPGGIATDFTLTELAAALSVDELELEGGLAWLTRNALYLRSLGTTEWPDGSFSNQYEFTHALYQNVLYARVGAMRRAQQHCRVGLRLENGFRPHCSPIASRLSVHFTLGREYAKAARYLVTVAETASARGANREAIHALEKAKRLTPRLTDIAERNRRDIDILLLLAQATTAHYGNATPSIEHCYLEARTLCEKIGDQNGLFRSLFGLRSFYVIQGDLSKAHELAHTLLGLASALNTEEYLLEAHVGLANSEFFAGNHQASHDQALKGIALYDEEAHAGHALMYGLDPGVFCYARAGQTAWFLGLPDQALLYVDQAVALATRIQHPYSRVLAIHNRTQILCYRGEANAALQSALEGKNAALQHGFAFLQAWAYHFSAWAYALIGDKDAALAELEQARTSERPRSILADSYLNTFLVEVYYVLGDATSGLDCLAAPAIERAYDVQRMLLRAALEAMRADTKPAMARVIELFKETRILSRHQGLKTYELKASVGLAQLLMRQRKYAEAQEYLRPTVSRFREGFNTDSVKQARSLLAQLKQRGCHDRPDGWSDNVIYLQAEPR